jgi:hypothetical protein
MRNVKNKNVVEKLGKSHKKFPLPGEPKLNNSMTKPINDGMNTPFPDKSAAHVSSESEAALYKQAENPLGNPYKK